MFTENQIELSLTILGFFIAAIIIYRKHSSRSRNDDNYQRDYEYQMQTNKKFRDYYLAGCKLKRDEKYDEAIEFFKKALIEAEEDVECKDVYNIIGICYYRTKNFYMAIDWFNKFLELPIGSLDAVEYRYMCYKELKMYIEAYEDATIYNELHKRKFSKPSNWFDFELNDLLKKATSVETNQFCEENVLPHSNLRYARFYNSFNKIIPQDVEDQSDLAWILKSKLYDKLLEFFFRDQCIENKQKFIAKYGTGGLFSYNLIHCTCQYLRGRYDDCVKILENPKTELELVFLEYVKLYLTDYKYSENLQTKFKNFKNKKNSTIRFWFAKYCYKNNSYHDYCNVLQSIKRGNPFVYAEILRNYNYYADNKFEKLEKEALRKFGHDENILIECCKRYVFLKDKDYLLRILNMMNKDSAAFMFYTGMYYSISGDQIRKIYAFKKTIEIDQSFYEAYLRLGLNYSEKDPIMGINYLNQSLKIVSCYDEAFTSIKEIIRIENIQKINNYKQKYDK